MGRTRLVAVAAVALLTVAVVPYVAVLALVVLLRPTARPTADRDDEWRPLVSVVIPTYNEVDIIETRLEALLQTEYPAHRLEVVVADDSDDDTADRVEEFFNRTPTEADLTLLRRTDRAGTAAAVNDAVEAADGDVVFRTDADARLAPDTIPAAVATLADSSIGAVTGRQTDVVGESAVESDYRGLLELVQGVETRVDSTFIAHGPCFAFRSDLFEPIPTDTVADDTAIAVAVRRNGHRVVMDPALEFAEASTSSLTGRRQRKDRRALGLLQLLFRHQDALGRYGGYGRVVLPLNWGMMIVAPWTVALAVALTTLLLSPFGLLALGGLTCLLFLGSRERLGPIQPLYAVLDAHLSLLAASARLATGDPDGIWDPDRESREMLK